MGFDQLRLTDSQEDHIARFLHIQINLFVEPKKNSKRWQYKYNMSLTIDMPVNGGAPVFRVMFVEEDDSTPLKPEGKWVEPRIARAGELVQDFLLKLKARSDATLTGHGVGDVGGKDLVKGLGLQRRDFQVLFEMLEHSHPDQ